MDDTLAFYVEKFLELGKPTPACSDETCVLQWVIHNTQVAQSLYDSAQDAGLTAEDLQKVEEMYRHCLQDILDTGLSALGVLEV